MGPHPDCRNPQKSESLNESRGGDQGGDQLAAQGGVKSRGGDQGGDQLAAQSGVKSRGGDQFCVLSTGGSLASTLRYRMRCATRYESVTFSYNGSRRARRPLSQEPCTANIVTAKSKNRTLVSPREQPRDSSVHRSGAPSVHREKEEWEAFAPHSVFRATVLTTQRTTS